MFAMLAPNELVLMVCPRHLLGTCNFGTLNTDQLKRHFKDTDHFDPGKDKVWTIIFVPFYAGEGPDEAAYVSMEQLLQSQERMGTVGWPQSSPTPTTLEGQVRAGGDDCDNSGYYSPTSPYYNSMSEDEAWQEEPPSRSPAHPEVTAKAKRAKAKKVVYRVKRRAKEKEAVIERLERRVAELEEEAVIERLERRVAELEEEAKGLRVEVVEMEEELQGERRMMASKEEGDEERQEKAEGKGLVEDLYLASAVSSIPGGPELH
jgi:hypothetical protein